MPLVFTALLLLGCPDSMARHPAPECAIAAARTELASGSPWRASRLLAPLLADSATRSGEVEWLAATAAARWGGWTEVRAALQDGRWRGIPAAGAAHELLARGALALGDDSVAAIESRLALEAASGPGASGVRRVLLARSLDRLGRLPEASTAYATAAVELPVIGDWLRLRAVTALATGSGSVSVGPGLDDSLVRAHTADALAAALERRRGYAAARDAYLAAGDTLDALRMQVAVAPDSGARAAVVTALAAATSGPAITTLLALLDGPLSPLGPREQLIAAAAAARAGQGTRAVAGYAVAFAAGLGDREDHFQQAAMLVRSGDPRAGAAAFRQLARDPALSARATYEEGRALLRIPDRRQGVRVLESVVHDHPRDSVEASKALFLIADDAVDRGDDATARRTWDQLTRRYPRSRLAPLAGFQAAIITYVRRDFRGAARRFDALADTAVGAGEANASLYWAGRSHAAAGDSAGARTRWRKLIARAPDSFYATAAAARLGLAAPPAHPAGPPAPIPSSVSTGAARIALLDDAGLDQEADWERQRLASIAGGADTLVAAATALRRAGAPALAGRVARAALAQRGVDSTRALLLLSPLDPEGALSREARRDEVDPAFAAALIRQESGFDPEAVSAAGARGMMQVMPAVGAALARRLRFPLWDPVLLFQPDVNLELGMRQLRGLFDRYHDPVRVLAAYNAGGARVRTWEARGGASDPEVFIERIPFPETRDYVRTVLRNREMYRRLYGW